MAEKIKVIIKEPGKAPEIKTVANDLGTLQSIVGGYIETVTLASGLVIICNEEGILWNLPYNLDIGGHSIVGTVVFAGVDGDEFADVPERLASFMPCGYHEGRRHQCLRFARTSTVCSSYRQAGRGRCARSGIVCNQSSTNTRNAERRRLNDA